MHDVTRELCLREARNVNFVNVIRGENGQNPYVFPLRVEAGSVCL